MTFTVSFAPDLAGLNRGIFSLSRDITHRAIPRALNTASQKTRTQFVRQLTAQLGLPNQKEIRKKVRPVRASGYRPIAKIWYNPRGLNPLKLGLSPAQVAKFYEGSRVGEPFVMVMPNGAAQIAVRIPKSRTSVGKDSKGRPRRNRLPVHVLRVRVGRKGIALMNRLLDTVGRRAMVAEYNRQIGLIVRGR